MLIKRLDKLLIQKLVLGLVEKAFMEGLNNKAKRRIGNTVCTTFLFSLGEMVIEISLSDICHQVTIIEGHVVSDFEGADYIQRTHTIVGAQKLTICDGEHIIGVEHASVYNYGFKGLKLLNSICIIHNLEHKFL